MADIFHLQPGRYFIGDPCYVAWLGNDDTLWSEYCEWVGNDPDDVFSAGDLISAAFHTRWGDGSYKDQFGHEYGVDAGIIGATKLPDDVSEKEIAFLEGCGNIVLETSPFTMSEDNGIIRVSAWVIDTNDDGDWWPEDEDDWSKDEDE